MIEFFDIFIKGIIVGLCVSVPLGPIGMLCVQRTLHRGRRHGIITGLGASASDLVYTIISLFFLSFIINFISKNEIIIQIIGSLIVCAFGWFIFRNNPSMQPKPDEKPNSSVLRDFFSSFALTLSNPLIMFVLIALFARFNFLSDKHSLPGIALGLLGIVAGATSWWAFLTLVVSRFRNKFNIKGLKMINRITGLIIIITGIVGIFTAFKII
ncbi:MAG: LysE family transporter [Paludibacter sp.]|nr:LysE family transporter [Paludibacter sp.]